MRVPRPRRSVRNRRWLNRLISRTENSDRRLPARFETLEDRRLLAALPVPVVIEDELAPGAIIQRTFNPGELTGVGSALQPEGGSAAASPVVIPAEELNGNGLQFQFNAAAGMPQNAIDGFQEAADLWSAILTDDILVVIDIDFRNLNGPLGQASSETDAITYADVRTAMLNDATSSNDALATANLPAGPNLSLYTTDETSGAASTPMVDNNGSANNRVLDVNFTVAKALGLRAAGDLTSDASIAFSDQFTWDFDRSNGITGGAFDFVGVAAHEIGHALGFTSGVGVVDATSGSGSNAPLDLDPFRVVKPLDLYRSSAASVTNNTDLDIRADTATKNFTLDGGTTTLTTFSTGRVNGDGQQGSHWKDSLGIGAMDPTAARGEYVDITDFDIQAFDVIGWDVVHDFGDAPDTTAGTGAGDFQTELDNDGPRHYLFAEGGQDTSDQTGRPKVFLGSTVDSEIDGQPSGTSAGDGSDEDGIVAFPTMLVGGTTNVTVNSTGGGANLDYFVDFTGDGDFDDPGESFTTVLNTASEVVPIVVPAGATIGNSVARFRISTAGGLSATGPAADGEVEDYQVLIDSGTPGVRITESGTTDVTEEDGRDTYSIGLNNIPAAAVEITVTADVQTEVSTDGVNFSNTAVFSLTDAVPQVITVRGASDGLLEGNHTGTISHAISSTTDPDYQALPPLGDVTVNITDAAQTAFNNFLSVDPLGSLIYDPPIAGDIAFAGEIDTYTVDLDAGQTLTVTLTGMTGLQGDLEVRDPSNVVIATATAGAAGDDVIIQTVSTGFYTGPTANPGTYTIRVTGAAGTTGAYSVESILNAAVEEEEFGGATNNDTASAQDLASSFFTLNGGISQRGAVLGTAQSASSDVYEFSLFPGQSTTLGIAGDVELSLLDSGEQLIATGVTATDLDQVINNFVSPAGGTFFAVITSIVDDIDYSLVITKDADFDSEENDSIATAQTLYTGFSANALGHVSATDSDHYSFEVSSFDSLTLQGILPIIGPLDPVNDVDLSIELFDPTGSSVALDDGTGAGQTAIVGHFATMTGTYTARVSAIGGTEGEYFLDVFGQSGPDPAPTVVSESPADASTELFFLPDYTVDFSEPLDLRTIDPGDLLVNGIPATGVTIIDHDTLEFDITAADTGNGLYAVSIAAGAIDDLQGTGNEAFNATFTIDNTATFSGIKFEDINGNGTRDAGEPGLGGVTIYVDSNTNGVLDGGEPFAVTAPDGTYTIVGPAARQETLREIVPAGFTQTTPVAPPAPTVVITEFSEQVTDFFEIQNVTNGTISTNNWFMAASLGDAGNGDINNVHPDTFDLPAFMTADQILAISDEPGDPNFWGSNLDYGPGIDGWVLLIDGDTDTVIDSLFIGYTATEIAGFNINVNGVAVTAADVAWDGDGLPTNTVVDNSHQRVGFSDGDSANNFVTQAVSIGLTNAGLTTPFLPLSGGVTVQVVAGVIPVADFGNVWNAGYDFGDALDTHSTLLASGGPVHRLSGTFLGTSIDAEINGIPTAGADGDDLNGIDDENSIAFTSLISPGTPATLEVVTSSAGEIAYWVDFDASGTFDNATERFSFTAPAAGTHSLTMAVPGTAVLGNTAARFRIASSAAEVADPTGFAVDGEVEDHIILIEPRIDFGDAPTALIAGGGTFVADYPTLLTANGARHRNTGPRLGGARDGEINGLPSVLADGDNTDGSDDENGVTITGPFASSTAKDLPGVVVVNLQNPDPVSNFLDVWIDWNRDGDWNDPDEQIVDSLNLDSFTGDRSVNFVIPEDTGDNVVPGLSYARFRLSTTGGLGVAGLANDGEVEDYQIEIINQGADYGDAPALSGTGTFVSDYPTLFADDGARHADEGPRLGVARDVELDGVPTTAADGDDTDVGGDDEDGIVFSGTMIASALHTSTGSVSVELRTADPFSNRLDGWVDWNLDGDWSDPGEQIFNNFDLGVVNGIQTLNFTIPQNTAGNVVSGTSYARFRVSTAGGLGVTGSAVDGEVEDHTVEIVALEGDFGDAPTAAQSGFASSYPTTLADNGARHTNQGPRLGVERDTEADGLPLDLAIGDDNDNLVDEDGIDIIGSPTAFTLTPSTGTVTVNLQTPGPSNLLDAWIDWNRDGDWNDPGEQIFTSFDLGTVAGSQDLNFTIPQNDGSNVVQGLSYARFRVSSAGGLGPMGVAVDGEVEDHQLQIITIGGDFGDAPTAAQAGAGTFVSDYPVTVAQDGARHTNVGPTLGADRDVEADGNPSVGALGDDAAGSDDEDGVTFAGVLTSSTASVTVGTVDVELGNADPTSNRLDAWIDWNRDGDWDDPGEQIFTNFDLGTANGVQTLNFDVPQDTGANVEPGASFARFRISTAGGLGAVGLANDGEVEDLQVQINSATPDVLISETGTTDVVETGATDTFNVQLTTIPAAPVNVTVTADNETLLSTDGVNFFSSVVLTFNDLTAQAVTVQAIADADVEGLHTSTITSTVTTADPIYAAVVVADVIANVTDNASIPITGFDPVEPLGSLIYDPPVNADISVAGEIDNYSVSLDPDQTITVTLTTDPSLQSELEIRATGGVLLASSTAAAAGDDLFLQTISVAGGGTFAINVTGAAATTGAYTLEVILNSAVEEEEFGGGTNDTTLTAQDLSSSFVSLGGGIATRGAVLGTAQSASDDFFRFSVLPFQTVSLAVTGAVTLSLLDPFGTMVAAGIAAANVDAAINDFRSPAAAPSTFFAMISSAVDDVDYSLVVTRDADFDTENNSSFDNAQDITTSGAALGYAQDLGAVTQFDTPIVNIDGQGFNGVQPPDTVGDVGIDYYVQAINHPNGSAVTIYNKSDGSVAVPEFFMDTLAPSGPGTDGAGDPIVLFDHLANRWFMAEFGSSSNGLSVFVSQTSDPTTGNWNHYFFGTAQFPDYPKFSVWPDGYYVSTNEGGDPPVYVMDRENMLLGNPARPIQRFTDPGSSLAGFGFQAFTPADVDGPAPPTDAPAIFMRHRDDEVHNVGANDPAQDFLEIWEFDSDLDTPALSSFTQVANIPIAEIDSDLCGLTSFSCFAQPGTTTQLDPLREVIMWRLQYRNFGTHEALVGNLTTDVDGTDHGGVRWFELRRTGGLAGTWGLHQEGTVAPDGDNRWMGAVAMDGKGNIAVGYNVGSSTTSPGIRYTGRLESDPLGTMPQGEHTLVDGIGNNGSNRWGDYSAMSIDPVDDETFWFTGEYADNGVWNTRIGAFVLDAPSDNDFYQFNAVAGNNLTIETFTPLGGPLDAVNDLDPVIELIDPTGASVIVDDNSAGDGRNAAITATAAVDGSYRVRVSGTAMTAGEYFVSVTGHTGADPAPSVISTTPVDGSTVPTFPLTYTVNFSEGINVSTVAPADLTVNGVASTAVTVVDGDTFTFTIDPSVAAAGDGTYAVALAAGNVLDLQGVGNELFLGSFVLDTTGPRVTSTLFNGASLGATKVIAPGPLTFVANFDEALKVFIRGRGGLRTPTAADISLVNNTTGQVFPALAIDSNPAMTQFMADFAALPEGNYTLTLTSGDDAFEDPVGNDLDGEPLGLNPDGTISGDGVNGGDYVLNFFVDDSVPLNPFTRVNPLGSLISGSVSNLGTLHGVTDQDDYGIFLEAGTAPTAQLVVDPGVIGTIEIVELGLTASSLAPGQPVALPPTIIPADGIYTLRLTADVTTTFDLQIFQNTVLESSLGDTDFGNRLLINPSELELRPSTLPGRTADRFAAVGTANGIPIIPQFTPSVDFGAFVDISPAGTATGTALGLLNDDTADIVTTIGNAIFPAGDVTVSNNGGIISGAGAFLDPVNTTLPTAAFDNALLPFWDDFGDGTGDVYWEEGININGHDALVIQWDLREHFDFAGAGDGTIQLQLFETGPILARYVYRDVELGDATVDLGASATIGYQESTTSALTFSVDTASVNNFDVIDLQLLPVGTDVDYYEIDLTGSAGQTIDVVLDGHSGVSFAGESLEILNSGGAVLATASPAPLGVSSTNYDLGILDFTVPADGVYTLRVTSTNINGNYSVVVTDALTFDSEPNQQNVDPKRDLTQNGSALGYVDRFGDRNDIYSIDLAAGQLLEVSTQTLFDDPSAPVSNTLNPELRVIHPNGSTTIANDTNSAPDGKNASLSFFAPVAGTYTIRVRATSGLGEYLVTAETPLPTVTLSVDNTSIPETGGLATFTATLSHFFVDDVLINLGYGGAATEFIDYTRTGTNIVIPAGAISGSETVFALPDNSVEAHETVIVDITSVFNAIEATPQQATTTIIDDDFLTPIITTTAANPTSLSPIPMMVDFGEAVTGFVSGDVQVTNGNVVNFASLGAGVYTFGVVPTADALITVDVPAAAALDLGGKDTLAATQLTIFSDTTPPVIIPPPDIIAEGNTIGGVLSNIDAIVTFLNSVTATDNIDPTVPITNDAPAFLPLGPNTITFTATDIAGNVSMVQTIITVVDTTPPVISGPASVLVEADTVGGTDGTRAEIVAFLAGFSSVDLVDPTVTFSNDAPAFYPVGNTTVTFTASDDFGNTSTRTGVVTVVDTTPPSITVPADITVEGDTTGGAADTNVDIAAFLAAATGTDIVDPSVLITDDAPTVLPVGDTLVTFTATDDAGNATTGTATITVTDTTAPIIAAPATVTIEGDTVGGASNPGTAIDAFLASISASDIVDATLTITNDAPAFFPLGDTTVTFNTVDDSGNPATASTVVTVVDTTDPIITPPLDSVVEGDTTGGALKTGAAISAILASATGTDIVDATLTISEDGPAVFPLGDTVVTFTTTDQSGNTGTATATITVVDTTAPNLTPPGDTTIEADTTGGASSTGVDVLAFLALASSVDIVDANPTISNDAPALLPLGDTVITFRAVDASGNESTATATVTVVDTTSPTLTAPIDTTVEADTLGGADSGNATIAALLASATATDVFDANPVISNDAPALFPLGDTLVTFTATDSVGNVSTATTTVTVVDTTPPLVTAPNGQTLEGNETGGISATDPAVASFLALVTSVDLVDANPVISSDVPAFLPLGDTLITFTSTDAQGNASTSTATLTVVDTTPPTQTAPANISVEADITDGADPANAAVVAFLGGSTASDLVDANPVITNDAPATFPLGVTVVTFTATDASGNSSDISASVTVVDTSAPNLIVPADLVVEGDAFGGASASNASINAFFGAATATDIADAAPTVSAAAPAFFPLGATEVTFTATDAAGNETSATATVTVIDTTTPTLTLPADTTVEGDITGGADATNAAIAALLAAATSTDIVDSTPTITNDAPATFPLGDTVVTFTSSDDTGNQISDTVTVTVVDTTAPTVTPPADITVEGDTVGGAAANGAAIAAFLASATTTDVVDASPSLTNDAPTVFAVGDTVVTFTSTDAAGNVSTETATVTVVDSTQPTISAPADVTVEGDTIGGGDPAGTTLAALLSSATSLDIVDANPTITNDAPTLFPLGDTVVTFTATDASGNASSITTTVTIVDTTAPSVTAPASLTVEGDTTSGADATGTAIATFLAGATAADVVDANPTITNDAPSIFPVGDTVVTFTSTDASGNSATSTATVSVTDTTSPTINAPADITVEGDTTGGADAAGAAIAALLAAATSADIVDANPSITNDAPALFPLGDTLVTFTSTDAAGNADTATTTVTVVDTTAPAVTVPADISVATNNLSGADATEAAIASFLAAGSASDVVDSAPTISHDAPSVLPPGDTTVTFTGTDASGNESTGTAVITVTVNFDLGDAPTPYPVTIADDGARHVPGTLFLGSLVDIDADGQPDAQALGDDNNGDDDEDGVAGVASLVATTVETTSSFRVVASEAGKLDGWIDFNSDGDWDDAGEQIFAGVDLVAGTNLLSFSIPSDAADGNTAARFRVSTAGGLDPTGEAADGEVEDYILGLIDGDATGGAAAQIDLGGDSIVLSIDAGQLVAQVGSTDIFRAPLTTIGTLDIFGTPADESVTVDLADLASIPAGSLAMDGGGGNNAIVINGDELAIDMTTAGLAVTNFNLLDLSGPDATKVTLNAAVVNALSPTEKLLTILGGEGDEFALTDASDWLLVEPVIRDGVFFIRADNQAGGGEVIEASLASSWHNFLRPGDINNDGSITAADSLRIINETSRRDFSDADGNLVDPAGLDQWPNAYFDHNNDGRVSALDALRVINDIARLEEDGAAEEIIVSIGNSRSDSAISAESNDVALLNESRRLVVGNAASADALIEDLVIPSQQSDDRDDSVSAVDQLLSDEAFLDHLAD